MNGAVRTDASRRPPQREDRSEGALTLARAFQLMTQALSEFRSPVGQEALRLRMVAMHGREDPLLDVARFPRLLRQANDAEVADVRKVGDDDYEISAQRSSAKPALPPAAPLEEVTPMPPVAEGITEAGTAPNRDNGQRLGLRFRRGSRAPTRAAEIPLVGVVQIEPSVQAQEPSTPEPAADPTPPVSSEAEPPKRPRPRRAPRKPAATAPAPAVGDSGAPAETPPPKRPRSRARRVPE
jgi:hypothetical protein